jgi:Ni2+-binding GTPase involved in maturation of urease and hydrogenase
LWVCDPARSGLLKRAYLVKIFADADAVVINKADLLSYVDFDIAVFRRAIEGLNSKVKIFELSCKTGAGVESWCSWVLNGLMSSQGRSNSTRKIALQQ